ncbi:MAG TPA: HAMP domain-containing sensor histidine kinase [Phnomibacter sp.]|nr:HAMP domain-containing sensor histidine kinase [Phnomibacter sp.]
MQNARKKLALVTVIYWFLLAYIMSALVWWFISLDQQNKAMAALRLSELNPAAANYEAKKAAVMIFEERKHLQYVGEGITFMLLIWLGAVFVYVGARRYLKLSQAQQNFMMAVTHELKTPIAIARLNIETLQKRQLDDAQKNKLLQQTLTETKRLNDLCDNILLASRFDSGTLQKHFEEILLNDLVYDAVEHFSASFPDRVIEFEERTGEISLQGDRMLLLMMINNLVENAIKYAPKSTPIVVALDQVQGKVQLSVADAGKGIPAEEKRKVFDKFYRIGDEQTRKTKGTGLGLFLVKRIAFNHNATVEIKDNFPQGSIFTISFN